MEVTWACGRRYALNTYYYSAILHITAFGCRAGFRTRDSNVFTPAVETDDDSDLLPFQHPEQW